MLSLDVRDIRVYKVKKCVVFSVYKLSLSEVEKVEKIFQKGGKFTSEFQVESVELSERVEKYVSTEI